MPGSERPEDLLDRGQGDRQQRLVAQELVDERQRDPERDRDQVRDEHREPHRAREPDPRPQSAAAAAFGADQLELRRTAHARIVPDAPADGRPQPSWAVARRTTRRSCGT